MRDDRLLERTFAIARDYLAGLDEQHVGPRASIEQLRSALDVPLPDAGVDADQVIEELARGMAPGLVASAGPRYFGFVIGGSVPAALAADWLASAWDQNAAIYAAAPAACVAEGVCARWVVELFGLPSSASVGFVTGGQMANFTGLAAARHAVLERTGWDVERQGLIGAPTIRVLVGEEAHVTVVVAVRLLGLGSDSVERVAVDDQGRMRPEALDERLSQQGPAIVCAQAGNIDTGAVDPIAEIAEIAARYDAWCHVDGAFGLWAAASPAYRRLVSGIERADSWVADAHKWLNVPYDSSFAIVKDPEAHRAAMALTAAYLPRAHDEERWPAEWVPELSRRARALPVYAALRSLGREGVARIIENCCARAAQLAELLANVPEVEILNEVSLNQVLLRFSDDDDLTERAIRAVQDDGVCWLAGTTFRGRRAMRVSICNWATSEDDIERSARSILAAARRGD
jgi:glutamate/tyrosine decarboxylase-like PLP-dependent enzyme